MLQIVQSLRDSNIIANFEIIDFKEGDDHFYFSYIKIKADIIDGSELYIREYRSLSERNYSFHWQIDGKIIVRWDNAPHHRELKTFPHHKHDPNPNPSYEIEIDQILKIMSNRINV